MPAVSENHRNHGDDLDQHFELSQFAGLNRGPETAIERRPLTRNSRPMITTAIGPGPSPD
jgi:hypothetical protein